MHSLSIQLLQEQRLVRTLAAVEEKLWVSDVWKRGSPNPRNRAHKEHIDLKYRIFTRALLINYTEMNSSALLLSLRHIT